MCTTPTFYVFPDTILQEEGSIQFLLTEPNLTTLVKIWNPLTKFQIPVRRQNQAEEKESQHHRRHCAFLVNNRRILSLFRSVKFRHFCATHFLISFCLSLSTGRTDGWTGDTGQSLLWRRQCRQQCLRCAATGRGRRRLTCPVSPSSVHPSARSLRWLS